ncbi:MAG: hypothetical protein E6F99_00190 [Actinobacteria bacterium]|nr:MAG: hypothetical protein E6F99_00190 [Actinomycetota bacterium]
MIEVPEDAGLLVLLARYVGVSAGTHVVLALSPLGGVTVSALNEFDVLVPALVNVAALGAIWSAPASATTMTAR